MKLRKKHKHDAKHQPMELDGLSSELRLFLALGNLCAAAFSHQLQKNL